MKKLNNLKCCFKVGIIAKKWFLFFIVLSFHFLHSEEPSRSYTEDPSIPSVETSSDGSPDIQADSVKVYAGNPESENNIIYGEKYIFVKGDVVVYQSNHTLENQDVHSVQDQVNSSDRNLNKIQKKNLAVKKYEEHNKNERVDSSADLPLQTSFFTGTDTPAFFLSKSSEAFLFVLPLQHQMKKYFAELLNLRIQQLPISSKSSKIEDAIPFALLRITDFKDNSRAPPVYS